MLAINVHTNNPKIFKAETQNLIWREIVEEKIEHD